MAKAKKKSKKTKKKESKQRIKNRHLILKILVVLVITLLMYIGYCILTLPNMEEAINRTRQPSTVIAAENGNEITTFGSVYSEVIHVDELPQYVPDAIISTEDRRFYSHFGFDVISFTRAMLTNMFLGRYAQGGSTITQQVAKNLFLTPNKNIKRKTQELLLAFWLEYKFSKEQILTLYLNRVYLGSGTYGIEAASQKYFQKSSRDLNLKEAAVIAGMLKAPSRYNPIASEERAVDRAKVVLQNMVNNRVLTQMQAENALKMRLGPEKKYNVKDAMHFADWVYNDVNAYIGERDNDIYVLTTLDQDLQQAATRILSETIKANREKRNVTQGAIVVMDKTGAIKAMVGGTDYNKSQFNRAIQALRQPGSAFKPFVYLTALQDGFAPDDVIMDVPLTIGKWKPENADKKYYGEVTLQQALTKSLNLATVNLSEMLSKSEIIRNAERMGITTDIQNSPSLALGTFEVKVIDMAVHEVATITADKTICDCARQMRLEHVGSLVVVNDDQTPLGMITDRDIAIEVVARNLDPMKLTVRDVMTTPVVTAGPSESMVVALARMREFGVRRLPIVDEEGKLVGVISNSNLVEELSSLLDSLVRNIHSSKTREVALRSDE